MRHYIYLLLLVKFSLSNVSASHIIGGYISYEIQGDNQDTLAKLDITLTLYKDSDFGAALADFIDIGIYSRRNNLDSFEFYSLEKNADFILEEFEPNPIFPMIRMEAGYYSFSVLLPKGYDYLIAHQRCCRADGATNAFSDEEGMAQVLELSAAALEQNITSPTLTGKPVAVVPINKELNFNLPLNISSDSVEMNLSILHTAGGSNVSGILCDSPNPSHENCLPPFDSIMHKSPYTPENPFSDANELRFENGNFSGKMNVTGRFLYGVEFLVYKDNELMSRQILDYGLNSVMSVNITETDFNKLSLYPNPSQGKIYVNGEIRNDLKYQIFNLQGQSLEQGIVSPKGTIDLALEKGSYVIKLWGKDNKQLLVETISLIQE